MRIISLETNPEIYSSNAYLILGNWSTIDDVNTLIDVGTDGFIINHLERIYTGVGKRKIDKVFLTHNHFDHIGGLKEIKEKYDPLIFAHTSSNYIDKLLKDGEMIVFGDMYFEVIFTPAHSSDSVCFYCEEEQVLFAGDTPINIKTIGGSYDDQFIISLEKLSKLKIKTIYHGHDNLITENAEKIIKSSLDNVYYSMKQN
jgi:glyoxylase-like metal-dependent hydrolase (beta-lactamase superfamily II)